MSPEFPGAIAKLPPLNVGVVWIVVDHDLGFVPRVIGQAHGGVFCPEEFSKLSPEFIPGIPTRLTSTAS